MSTILTACVLLRDALPALEGCLGPLRAVCDEIVLIHSGECAPLGELPEGTRAELVPWTGDEAALIREACARAAGTHVLVMDVRERLHLEDAEAFRAALDAGEEGALYLPVVEADRPEPELAAVVDGHGRLGDVALTPRLLHVGVAGAWRGVREPRLEGITVSGRAPGAWLISTRLVRGTPDPEAEDAAWIRATVVAPDDAWVLAGAARRLRSRGRDTLAAELAERAVVAAIHGPPEALVQAVVVAALCDLDARDAVGAWDRVGLAREHGLEHPDLDLMQALIAIELDTPDALVSGRAVVEQACAAHGRWYERRPLAGATRDAAELARTTLALATGDLQTARAALDQVSEVGRRSLPASLHTAELAIREGRPATALRLLVDRLEHAGADGWILAAEAAAAIGHDADRAAFLDRATAHLDAGLLAPHRGRRLQRLRAVLAAEAVLERLAGDTPARPDVEQPLAAAEEAARDGELETAHALVVEHLRRMPGDRVAWNDLGVVLHEAGAAEAASLALRVAVELEPDDADLRVQLAVVLFAAGRWADAATQARAALSRDELPDARAVLAALDVEGPPAPVVAVLDPESDAVDTIRSLRARPVVAHAELVEALGGPQAWLSATRPDVLLLREGTRSLGRAGVDLAGLPAAIEDARTRAPATASARRRVRDRPVLSVVIPVRDATDDLVLLLDRLALQDLPPWLFEVIVVDDGSRSPISRARLGARPFALTLLRQRPAGLPAARNVGVARARAETLWFLDVAARPAPDAARGHVVGQARTQGEHALVGGFTLLERHRRTTWDHLLADTSLLRPAPTAAAGASLPWQAFHVNNTSVARAALLAAGGFDPDTFPDDIHAAEELALRLDRSGVSLIHRPDLGAGEDRRRTLAAWLDAAEAGGRALRALAAKHPDQAGLLRIVEPGRPAGPTLDALRSLLEHGESHHAPLVRTLSRLVASPLPTEPSERQSALGQAWGLACRAGETAQQRGLVATDAGGADPRLGTVSVVLAHDAEQDGAAHRLLRILVDLRTHTPGPVECVIVHAGRLDPRIATLPDIATVPVLTGVTREHAWSVGLGRATGDALFLCDDDILFVPGWRERLLEHLAAWPDVGVVSALGGRSRTDLARIAPVFAAEHEGEHAWPLSVRLERCLLRREALDRVGAPDPAMGSLAGLDWSLRLRRAGFRVRLAGDVLMGARRAPASASVEAIEAFTARRGVPPVDRDALLLAAERPFEPARDALPVVMLQGETVLLGPHLPALSPPQSAQGEVVHVPPPVPVPEPVAVS